MDLETTTSLPPVDVFEAGAPYFLPGGERLVCSCAHKLINCAQALYVWHGGIKAVCYGRIAVPIF